MSTKLALSKKPTPKQTTFIKPKRSLIPEDRPKSPNFGNQQWRLSQSRNNNIKASDSLLIKKQFSSKRQSSNSQASENGRGPSSQSSRNGSQNQFNQQGKNGLLQKKILQSQSMRDARLNIFIKEPEEEKTVVSEQKALKKDETPSILQRLNAIQNLNLQAMRAESDSFSPIRPNTQAQGQGSAVGHKGRYNVLLFYQSLINVISTNEKTQVLCSHLLKQLNNVLSETFDGQTSVSNMMNLLKAVEYFKDCNFQISEQLLNPETPVEQAQSILFYLKHIRNVGVSNMFSLTDIIDHNTQPILLHLVQLFLVLTKDGRLRDATDWSLSPTEVSQVRIDIQPLRVLNDETFKSTSSINDVRMVELRSEMRALQKSMEAKHAQVVQYDSDNRKLKQQVQKLDGENVNLKVEIQKLQGFIKASRQTIKFKQPPQLVTSPKQNVNNFIPPVQFSQPTVENIFTQPVVEAYVQLASPQISQMRFEEIQQQMADGLKKKYELEMTEFKIRTANKLREYHLKEEMIAEYIQQIKQDYLDQIREIKSVAPSQALQVVNPKAEEENISLRVKITEMEQQLLSLKQVISKLEVELKQARGVENDNFEILNKSYEQKEKGFQLEVADLKGQITRAQSEINQFKNDWQQAKTELESVKSEMLSCSNLMDELKSQHKKEIEQLKKDHFDKSIQAESAANKKVKDQVQQVKSEAEKANLLVGTLEKRLATAVASSSKIEELKKQAEEANLLKKQVEDAAQTELSAKQKMMDKLSEQLKQVKKAMDETKEEHEEELESMAGKIGQLKDQVKRLQEEVSLGQIKISEASKLGQASSQDATLVADLKQKCEVQTLELQRIGSELVEMGKFKSQMLDENIKLKQEFDSASEQLAKSKEDLERALQEDGKQRQQAQQTQQILENMIAAKEKDVQLAHSIEKSLRLENDICKTDLKKFMQSHDALAKANKKIEALEAQLQSESFTKRKLNQKIEQLQDEVQELTEQIEQLKGQCMSGGGMSNMGMSPMGGMGMGMVMPGISPMGGMGNMGMGGMNMNPMASMVGMGLMGNMGMQLPSSFSEIPPSIEVSLSSPAPKTLTNSKTQDKNLLFSIEEVKEIPLSPNALENESIADNFKALLQPPIQRDLTKILEEAEYGHESDSSYASSVRKSDVGDSD